MSKFTHKAHKPDVVAQHKDEAEVNFMAGTSYKLDPLQTLRIMATSCIFGEPQYYRDGNEKPKSAPTHLSFESMLFGKLYSAFSHGREINTAQMMEKVIDDALDYDFGKTLEFAVDLRKTFNMRLNPAIIMVRAAMHPKRLEWTSNPNNPRLAQFIGEIAFRPDDLTSMIEYYIAVNESKKEMPSILKRSVAARLVRYNQYQLAKYQSKGIGLIDVARITHAHLDSNPHLKALMKEGKLPMPEDEETWRHLRSEGKTWSWILANAFDNLTHFDLVNQLRSMFEEVNDTAIAKKVMKKLVDGVPSGKLFPYRYYVAHGMINSATVNHKQILLDGLEEAIDKAVENLPKLKGRTMVLSDNSGSAWGAVSYEEATVRVAEIDNLSAFITGMASDEGHVGFFGDKLITVPVSKRNGALAQLQAAQRLIGENGMKVGHSTENGIWLFFDQAISKKEHWDNIFIYSDQQAGHGGLYGINGSEFRDFIYGPRGHGGGNAYIDVLKLVDVYRKRVNPKVNVFSVQTAGYSNMVIPGHIYRGALLSGWTGKEALFASQLIKEWDAVENPPRVAERPKIVVQQRPVSPQKIKPRKATGTRTLPRRAAAKTNQGVKKSKPRKRS